MPASPTTTRDSSDSMTGKQAEKTFEPASNPETIDKESKGSNRQVVRTLKETQAGTTKEWIGKE
jgi:hypothetical protein